MKRHLKLFLLFFILSTHGFCQTRDFKEATYWGEWGVGSFNTLNDVYGMAACLGLNLLKDSTLYKIRFYSQEEINLFGPTPSESFYDVGFLMGKGLFMGEYVAIYLAGGLGLYGGTIRVEELNLKGDGIIPFGHSGHFETNSFLTVSVPVEVTTVFKISRYFGPGISIYGNLNMKRPSFGLNFHLNIGKLK